MNRIIAFILCLMAAGVPASELSDAAAACKVNGFRPVSTVNALNSFKSGTLNEPLFPYSNGGVWEPVSQRMLYIGAAHQVPLRFIGYTATDNNWRVYSMPSGFTGVSHSYDQETIDSAGMLYYIQWSNARMYLFNTRTNQWVDSIDGATGSFGTLDYFPEKNGLVRTLNGSIRFYNISTHQWEAVGGVSMGSMHNLAQYSHSAHCVYFGGGDGSRAFYRLDTNFSVRSLAPFPVDLGVNIGHITADPVTGTIIIMKPESLWAYDAAADAWNALCKNPLSTLSSGYTAVIPISTYGVVAILSASQWPVLLYKYAEPVAVEQPSIAEEEAGVALSVSPNPFKGHVTLRAGIRSGVHSRIAVLDCRGRLLHVLWEGTGSAEHMSVQWKAGAAARGVYLAMLECGKERMVKPVLLQ